MGQTVKLRRSAVSGRVPNNSQLQLGELSMNTTDGKIFLAKSGSEGPSIEEVIITNTQNTGSLDIVGSISGSFLTGSFIGDGSGLYNIPASGVTGLSLDKISSGASTASIDANGLQVNVNTSITGSLTATEFTGSGLGLTNVPLSVSGSDANAVALDNQFTKFHFDDSTGIKISGDTSTGVAKIYLDGVAAETDGGTGATSKLEVTSASSTWTFNHNLGEQYPSIIVFDSDDNVIIPQNIEAVSSTQLIVSFASPQTGYVTATVGGGLPSISSSYAGRVLAVSSNGLSAEWIDGVVSGSEQIDITGTTNYSVVTNRIDSIESFTSSIDETYATDEDVTDLRNDLNLYTSSTDDRLDSLETISGSHDGRLDSLETTTGSLDSRLDTIETTFSTSVNTRLTNVESSTEDNADNFMAYTSSTDDRLDSLETESGSIRTTLNSYTSSANGRLDDLENGLDNLNIESGSIRTEFNSYTSSTDDRLDSIETTTGSHDGRLDSLETTSGSHNTRLGNLETFETKVDGGLEFTGSNVTIKGDLLVKGTETRVDSTTVEISDNIISLNGSGAASAGIEVRDTTSPGLLSGSLLWDSTNNYWVGGTKSNEERLLTNTDLTNLDGRLDSLETESGSIRSDFNSYTSSNDNNISGINGRLGSLETTSGSHDGRLDSIESKTGSFLTSTNLSDLQGRVGSLETTSGSHDGRLDSLETESGSIRTTLNSFTSSTNDSIDSIESFTSSIDTTIKNKLNTETVVSGSDQVVSLLSNRDVNLGTGDVTAVTGSFGQISIDDTIRATNFTGSFLRLDQNGDGLRMTNVGAFDNDGSNNFRIFSTNDLIIATGGDSGTAITLDASTKDATFQGNILLSGTVDGVDVSSLKTSFDTTTGSFDGRLDSLETESGSVRSALNSHTSSANGRLDSLESFTGSIDDTYATDQDVTNLRGDFNSYTSSNDTTNTTQNSRLTSLESATGSYTTTDYYTTGATFNTSNGVVTGTRNDGGTWTVDLDGRYLTSFTETDPIFSASPSSNIADSDIENWNLAYGWGDHSQAGYLTSHPNVNAATSSDNSGRTYIQDVLLDSNGHVTGLTTATETVVNTDEYTTGVTWNGTTAVLTFTRNDGDTYSVTMLETLSDVTVTGGTYNSGTQTLRLTKSDGSTVDVSGFAVDTDTNWYTTGATFNTVDGVLTIVGKGMSDVTVDLDGRYLTSYNDEYTTGATFNNTNGIVTFTRNDGDTFTVDLDGRYLTGYTETDPIFVASPAYNITDTNIENWNEAYGWGDHSQAGYLTSYNNEYVTGATFNTSNGIITFTRNDGDTFTVDIDGKYLESTGGTISRESQHVTQGSISASNAHLDLYNTWESDTDQKGSIITFTDNYYDGSLYRKTLRAAIKGGTDTTGNTADGYLEFYTDSSGANTPNLVLRLDRNKNAHFSGAITTASHGGSSQWNTAYGWGDHSQQGYLTSYNNEYTTGATFNTSTGVVTFTRNDGDTFTVDLDGRYLTSFTETDPIFVASAAYGITSTNISNWNTAYGWGNHATQGYLTSYNNEYVTGATFNTGNGIITFTRNDGDTFTVDIDGKYAESGHNHDSAYVNVGGDTMTGTLDVHVGDTGTILSSGNSSATGTPDQFFIKHVNGGVAIGNLRGDINFTSGNLKNDGNLVWDQGDFTTTQVSNWDTAYEWGDHSAQGYLTSYNNEYVTGASFNNTTAVLTFTRNDGDTFNVTLLDTLSDVTVTGGTYNSSNQTLTLTKSDGNTVDVSGFAIDTDVNYYTTGATFATSTGVVTGTLNNGSTWTVDLDGRYLTSFTETDPIFVASAAYGITSTNISNWNTAYGWGDHGAQGYITSYTNYYVDGLSFDTGTGVLTASVNGTTNQTVDLDGRYSLTSHNHDSDYVNVGGDTMTGDLILRNNTAGDGSLIRDITWNSTAAEGTDDRLGVIRVYTSAGSSTTRGGQMNFYTRQANSSNFNTMIYDRSGNLYVPTNVYSNSQQLATQAWVTGQNYLTSYNNEYTTGATFNTGNGIITFTRNDGDTFSVDIDGRFLTSYTETDTLATVTARGASTSTETSFNGQLNLNSTVRLDVNGTNFEIDTDVNDRVIFSFNKSGTRNWSLRSEGGNLNFYRDSGTGSLQISGNEIATQAWVTSQNYLTSYNNEYTTGATFNTSNGIITFTRNDGDTFTVDIDGRFLTSYTETDTLATVTTRGNTTSNSISVGDFQASHQSAQDATTKAEMLSMAVAKFKPHSTNSGTLAIAQVDGGNSVGLQFTNGSGTANWDMSLQPFGGNVGINKINPDGALHVYSGTSERFLISGDVHVQGSTDLNINGASRRFSFTSGTGTIRTTTANSLYLQTNSTTAVTIDSSQNVTIAGTLSASGYNKSNWDTAYGWGDHGSVGYITGYTETDTLQSVTNRGSSTTNDITISKSSAIINMGYQGGPHGINFYDDSSGNNDLRWGFYYRTTPDTITFETGGSSAKFTLDTSGNLTLTGTLSASGYNKTNWDTAYGWGDHSQAGYLISYNDEYTTGATFNSTTGILTFTRNDGDTYTVNMISTLSDVTVTGGTYTSGTQTLTLTKSDGNTVSVSGFAIDTDVNYYTTGATFNTGNGVITFTTNTGGQYTVDIDGRYSVTSHNHNIWDLPFTRSSINIDTVGSNNIWDYVHSTSTTDGTYPTSYMHIVSFGDRSHGLQFGSPYSSNTNLYYRQGTDNGASENGANTYKDWKKIWSERDFTSTQVSNWDTAYGWGDHGSVGYITGYTETDTLDSVVGRGSSTTNSITTGDHTISTGNPTLTLDDSNNAGGGGAAGKIIFKNTAGNAIGIGYTADDTASSDLIISTNAGSTYGGYLGLDAGGISDAQADIILDPKTKVQVKGDIDMGTNDITDTKVGQWDTAYGWGDHGSVGYITGYSETDTLATVTSRGAVTSDNITTGHHIILSGTHNKQSQHLLYIGGDGLASADASIYIGNDGAGGGYGWELFYNGVGSGNANAFILRAENLGTPIDTMTVLQDGTVTFVNNVSTSAAITASGKGTFDNLELTSGARHLTFTQSADDWFIYNDQQDNGIVLYNGTGGVEIHYSGSSIADFDSTGITLRSSVSTTSTLDVAGWATVGSLLVSNTAPYIDLVDTNSFTDTNDRFRIRAAGNVGQIKWYDDSAGADSLLMTFNPDGTIGVEGDIDMGTNTITDTKVGQWDTAYGWGNHSGLYMTQGQTYSTSPNIISNGGNRYDPSTDSPTNEHYAILTYGNGGNVTGQLATHFVTGKLYSRGHNNAWSGWRAYWSDSDFTSTNVTNWNTAYTYSQVGHLPLAGGTLTGDLTVGSTSRASDTVIRALSDDSHKSGFEAYGSSQGNGYLYVGQSTTHGGGISYNGDSSPAYVGGETSDYITFYRRDAGTNTEVFAFPYNSNEVYFNGNVHSGGGNSSQWNTAYGWGDHASVGYTDNAYADTMNQHVRTSDSPTFNNMTLSGDLTVNGNQIFLDNVQSRTKLMVWSGNTYGIGMESGYTYGHIGNEYVMSFQMSDTNDRGFWWGDSGHSNAQGAMSLTTQGKATIATSLSIGQGQSVTSPSDTPLYVEGTVSGSTVFEVQGTQGQLFSISDSLVGDIFEVSDISGIPILSVNSNGTVTIDDTLHVTGEVFAYYSSDEGLKENIKPIENAIDKVKMIGGYEFDWNSLSRTNSGHDVGVIAQEVEKVLPELVTTKNDGFKGVRYEKLTSLLIQANKELIQRVEELEEKLKKSE